MLFVHSPLVGPSSWASLAPLVRQRGAVTAVPDLTGVAGAPSPAWRWFVAEAVAAAADLPGTVVVVGHSGAGVMLPAIAAALGDRHASTVFVDAVVPPESGSHHTPPQLLELLDGVTTDDVLAPWLDWWPASTIAELLPSADLEASVRSDLPQLPRAFYDDDVHVPDGWTSRRNAYVQTSPAYDDDHRRAAALGWPTAVVDGTHLSILTDPGTVLGALDDVTARG